MEGTSNNTLHLNGATISKQKRFRIVFKSVINYLATVFTWSIFVLLFICALFLAYYFVSLKVYSSKGENYFPPITMYTIVSPSMTPTIKVYDMIVNIKYNKPEDVKIGDIITFKSTSSLTYGMTMTHRVIDIKVVDGKYEFTTQGDNNISPDLAPAEYENVIGRTIVKLPQVGRIQFFVASKFGWLAVVIVPALIIVIKDIKKLITIARTKKRAESINHQRINKIG